MKRFLAALLTASMLFSAASAATVEPYHDLVSEWPDEDYGECVTVLFDVETDFSGTSLTFTEYTLDEYKREEIEKLQPGNTILSFGEEITVETIEQVEDGYEINGGYDQGGVSLAVSEEDNDVFYSCSYNDILSHSALETRTLPMADQVRVCTYRLEDDGSYSGATNEAFVAAGKVQQYLLNSDVSLVGSHTIYVKDGIITEIDINWTPLV